MDAVPEGSSGEVGPGPEATKPARDGRAPEEKPSRATMDAPTQPSREGETDGVARIC